MMPNPVYHNSEVLIKKDVVEIGLSNTSDTIVVDIDRATAARLIKPAS